MLDRCTYDNASQLLISPIVMTRIYLNRNMRFSEDCLSFEADVPDSYRLTSDFLAHWPNRL